VPLRIAFDLDGVLADMNGELVRQVRALFGGAPSGAPREAGTRPAGSDDAAPVEGSEPVPEEVAAPLMPAQLQLTAREIRRLWRHVAGIDRFWESLAEIEEGSVARLAALADDRRWEIIFLTRRPEASGPTAQVQTQRWLQSRGFSLPSVFVVQGSRGKIAAALGLDVVVDDRPENCLDVVADSKARAILVWRPEEVPPPAAVRRLGIGVVRSVAECLEILSRSDEGVRDRVGVLERLMRMLGLKTATGSCV
jgi:hypothetical protein